MSLKPSLIQGSFARQSSSIFGIKDCNITGVANGNVNHIAGPGSDGAIDIHLIVGGFFIFFVAISLGHIATIGGATIASVTGCHNASQLLPCISIDIGMAHAITAAIGSNSHRIVLLYDIFYNGHQHNGNNIAVVIHALSIQIKHCHITIKLFASV